MVVTAADRGLAFLGKGHVSWRCASHGAAFAAEVALALGTGRKLSSPPEQSKSPLTQLPSFERRRMPIAPPRAPRLEDSSDAGDTVVPCAGPFEFAFELQPMQILHGPPPDVNPLSSSSTIGPQ